MKKHTISVIETLRRDVQVRANDAEEAKEFVEQKYRDENIILDSSDFVGVEFLDQTESFDLTQEQAEAIIQIQMFTNMLDNVVVMGWGDWYEDDDLLELGSDQLEAVVANEYDKLQLWRRG